jgi:hypothetical protein
MLGSTYGHASALFQAAFSGYGFREALALQAFFIVARKRQGQKASLNETQRR